MVGENVQRLKSFPSNPMQADIAKATGAHKALLKFEEALTTEEENLSKRLGLLYDKNDIIKPWAENESAFQKNNLIIIKKMKQEVNRVIGNLNHTKSQLLKRFNKSEDNCDDNAGLSKRRKMENKRKNEKIKEKNIIKQATNFLLILSETKTDRILPKDAVYNQKLPADPKILVEDLKALDHTMLQPSRYKRGLKYLIDNGAFDAKVCEQVESIYQALFERANQEKQERNLRNEALENKKSQKPVLAKNLFSYYGPTFKTTKPGSIEESESDLTDPNHLNILKVHREYQTSIILLYNLQFINNLFYPAI